MAVGSVLFDFDMTLVDSSEGIARCLNLMARNFGLEPLSKEKVVGQIGVPIDEACRHYWGHFSPEWIEYYRKHLRGEEYARLKLYSGALPLIRHLRTAGVALGIVTNRAYPSVAAAAVGVESLMDVVVGLDEVERGKPAPDPLLLALEKLGCSPEKSWYLGDTLEDMMAAKSAGIQGAGMLTGGRSPETLKRGGASKIFASLEDFHSYYVSLDSPHQDHFPRP